MTYKSSQQIYDIGDNAERYKCIVENKRLRDIYRSAFIKYFLEKEHPAYHQNIEEINMEGEFSHRQTQLQFEAFICGAELARSMANDILASMKTE